MLGGGGSRIRDGEAQGRWQQRRGDARGQRTLGAARLPSLPDPAKGGRGRPVAGDVRRKTEEGGQRQRSYLPDPAVGPPIPDPEASWGRVAMAAACSGRGRRSSVTLPLPDPDSDFPPPSPPPLTSPPWRQRAGAVSSWRCNSPPLPLPSQNPHGGIARGGGGRRGGRPNFFLR